MNSREYSTKNDGSGGRVTKIAFQKKRVDRRSVFIDGDYAFSVSEATFRQFPLQQDQWLTAKQIEIIKNHEDFEKTREAALKYLSLRMRSEYELKSYLKRKEFSPQNIRRVLNYCREHQYLDDRKYAELLVRDMTTINRYGRYKMIAQLHKRGISSTIIKEVLAEHIDSSDQLQNALTLAEKKLASLKNAGSVREKLYRYLKQRGFDYAVITEVINRLLKS